MKTTVEFFRGEGGTSLKKVKSAWQYDDGRLLPEVQEMLTNLIRKHEGVLPPLKPLLPQLAEAIAKTCGTTNFRKQLNLNVGNAHWAPP